MCYHRTENVSEYLRLSANADKQQVQRIKMVFEKKNQKSTQAISQLQRKLEEYNRRLKDVETYGIPSHKQAKDVLKDVGQGLKWAGCCKSPLSTFYRPAYIESRNFVCPRMTLWNGWTGRLLLPVEILLLHWIDHTTCHTCQCIGLIGILTAIIRMAWTDLCVRVQACVRACMHEFVHSCVSACVYFTSWTDFESQYNFEPFSQSRIKIKLTDIFVVLVAVTSMTIGRVFCILLQRLFCTRASTIQRC